MARILVTGGCGFIGSHLVSRLLEMGHEVRVLDDLSSGDRSRLSRHAAFHGGSVLDAELLAHAIAGADACVHLAAIASVERSHREWAATSRVNLGGTVAVFDAALRARGTGPIPVVYASSAAVYGSGGTTPLREDRACRPTSAYGADKLGGEVHARIAHAVHGLPTTGLRFFNVYGPRQEPGSDYSGVISVFADRLLHRGGIRVHGDGEQVRDFVYVGDVVDAIVAALGRVPSEPWIGNVCTGRGTSINALSETLARLVGIPLERHFAPARAGDIRVSVGDPARLRTDLGIDCATPIESGLRDTLAWLEGRDAWASVDVASRPHQPDRGPYRLGETAA